MADTDTVSPVRISGPVSIARLHGRACIHCGAVAKDLSPAGTVTVSGSDREWPIVTCGCRP
jgi:small ligand-binding sensory domain FIST